MNVPNLLSIFRLFVTFFFIIAVYHDRFDIALGLFIVQGLSDMLDGFIARVTGKKTDLGAFLDPLADKTMLVAAFVMLSIKNVIPVWLTVIVLLRDLVIALGFLVLYHLARTAKPVPSIFGKITTACQIGTILYVLWSVSRPLAPWLFYGTAFFIALSGLHYIYVGIRLLTGERVGQSPAGD